MSLPDDHHVINIAADPADPADPRMFEVMVTGPTLAKVPDGEVMPEAQYTVSAEFDESCGHQIKQIGKFSQ